MVKHPLEMWPAMVLPSCAGQGQLTTAVPRTWWTVRPLRFLTPMKMATCSSMRRFCRCFVNAFVENSTEKTEESVQLLAETHTGAECVYLIGWRHVWVVRGWSFSFGAH